MPGELRRSSKNLVSSMLLDLHQSAGGLLRIQSVPAQESRTLMEAIHAAAHDG